MWKYSLFICCHDSMQSSLCAAGAEMVTSLITVGFMSHHNKQLCGRMAACSMTPTGSGQKVRCSRTDPHQQVPANRTLDHRSLLLTDQLSPRGIDLKGRHPQGCLRAGMSSSLHLKDVTSRQLAACPFFRVPCTGDQPLLRVQGSCPQA